MDAVYGFDRAKTPRGLSYPLKRSVFDAALLEAKVSKVHCVYFWLRQGGRIVMRADFCGEGYRGRAAAGLSSVTVYAVPSSERQATEASIVSEILPRMLAWLRSIEQSGNVRRGTDQHFAASWEAGNTAVEAS